MLIKGLCATFDGRYTVLNILNILKSKIFPLTSIGGTRYPSDLASCVKFLSPKQMFWRLSIALSQVKAWNTSKNLVNKFR